MQRIFDFLTAIKVISGRLGVWSFRILFVHDKYRKNIDRHLCEVFCLSRSTNNHNIRSIYFDFVSFCVVSRFLATRLHFWFYFILFIFAVWNAERCHASCSWDDTQVPFIIVNYSCAQMRSGKWRNQNDSSQLDEWVNKKREHWTYFDVIERFESS